MHAERRGLGRGRHAGVDRPQHRGYQQHHGNQVARGGELLRQRRALGDRGNLPRIGQRPDDDVAGEQQRQHQPGDHAGDEQLRDRHVGGDAVDDHDDRRRDQQPQRARARERADGHALRVAALLQFGQRHLADGRAGRRRRARHGGEDRAADDVGVQQPPGHPLEPRREALEHVLGQPRAEQDLAHPDEQRQRGQRPRGRAAPDGDGHRVAGRARAEELHADPRDAGERQSDPHAAAQQQEQRDDQQAGDGGIAHSLCSASAGATWRRRPRHSSTSSSRNAMASTTVPTAIAICGIHSGVASLPVETSLNCQLWTASRTL